MIKWKGYSKKECVGKWHVWRLKKSLKRRDTARSKIKLKLHLKFGNHSFKIGRTTAVLIFSSWFPFPLLVASLLFRRIFMTSQMPLSSASMKEEDTYKDSLQPTNFNLFINKLVKINDCWIVLKTSMFPLSRAYSNTLSNQRKKIANNTKTYWFRLRISQL